MQLTHKKISLKATILFSTLLTAVILSGCGYQKDISYMPADVKQKTEESLQENLKKYNSAKDDSEKSKYVEEIAFNYMNLGKYTDSIKYYEKLLETNSAYYPALNNIAVMYDEMGETLKALTYEQKLYEANSTNLQVIEKFIGMLLKDGQLDNAQSILETYAGTDEGKGEMAFVSSMFSEIRSAKGLEANPKQTTK